MMMVGNGCWCEISEENMDGQHSRKYKNPQRRVPRASAEVQRREDLGGVQNEGSGNGGSVTQSQDITRGLH